MVFGLPIPNTLNPVTLTKQAVGAALHVVDKTLDVTAEYAEQGSHLLLPVPNKTELETIDDDGGRHSLVAKSIDGFREQLKRGLPIEDGIGDITALFDALVVSKFDGGQDDRKFLLERGLIFLARYPDTSILKKSLTDKVVTILYNDLPHPPQAIVGREKRYRSADGSGTSLWDPDMGKANSAYARTIQGTHPLPANELPSPELIFDALLKRQGDVKHPAGISSFFFAFANLVIHQLFHTDKARDPQEPWNKTSSYLDLSILYGDSIQAQQTVRKSDGTGMIHNDSFADYRLLGMPPSTGALAVLFSRNHNYICQRLLEINENGTFVNPPPTEKAKKDKQDEDLFQTARLVNSGFFMQTILADYLAAILGLVREGNSWALDPLTDYRNADHSVSERGTGNLVSIEFTALYHFHASISANDEKWAETMMHAIFPEVKSWDEITPKLYTERLSAAFRPGAPDANKDHAHQTDSNQNDPSKGKAPAPTSGSPWSSAPAAGARPFPKLDLAKPGNWDIFWAEGLQRDEATGKYRDADLAKILQDATAHPASAFRARGLSGLSSGFTMTRAILADAVALVRGDRFLTTDFTSFNLTAWGYKDALRNPNNSANGGTLCKLLTRTLPDFYPDNNAYTLFPFMVPAALRQYFKAEVAHKYDWDRPVARKPLKVIRDWPTAKEALQNSILTTEYPDNANLVFTGDKGYLQLMNDVSASTAEIAFLREQFAGSNYTRKHRDYVFRETSALIASKSYTLSGQGKKSVDIVRDVFINLPTRFVADVVLGLPLKTTQHRIGTLFEHELAEKLRDAYNFVFLQNDPTTHVARIEKTKETVDYLLDVTALHFASIFGLLKLDFGIITERALQITNPRAHPEWLQRLRTNAGGRRDQQLLNDAVSLAILIGAEYSQLLVHCLDTFLPSHDLAATKDSDAKARFAQIAEAARSAPNDTTAQSKLRSHVIEALRLAPIIPGVYRKVVSNDYVVDVLLIPALKPIISLKDLSRVQGNSGKLNSFEMTVDRTDVNEDGKVTPGTEVKVRSYLDKNYIASPWSRNMVVTYHE
ncbi:hypothetical protein FRB90_000735 [Tulasnella sp. 427]|nr:hypothetical protein FRB90_000735 [Tulasnella sp. 427]